MLVTGSGDLPARVTGLEAGADDYLVKPVHIDELIARVRALLRGRAAWATVVERELRERASIAGALTRLRMEESSEATAARICEELARLRPLSLVSILWFNGDGWTIPLALSGPPHLPWRAGVPLPERESRELRRRASLGPWVEHGGRVGATRRARQRFGDAERSIATLNAPIVNGDRLLGLLVVSPTATGEGASAPELQMRLPAVIDFAAVAALLLAPGLASRTGGGTDRAMLEAVIRDRAFTPVFQPILELGTGKTVGYEALTRFDDGADPKIRFTEASRWGLGIALERATLMAAIQAACALPKDAWLSINVSPSLVLEEHILPGLVRSTDRQVMVELTEHDPVDDYAKLRAAIELLGDGTRISIDDATAGWASMTHVIELQPAFVKLDMKLVRDVQNDVRRQALVEGLTYFASKTGCELIAEGIETQDQQDKLDELDVRFGQGYLLGRPRAYA